MVRGWNLEKQKLEKQKPFQTYTNKLLDQKKKKESFWFISVLVQQ